MGQNAEEAKLVQAREAIDEADRGIAELFAQRMRAVEQVAAYKAERGMPVLDAKREQQMLERESQYVAEKLRPYYVKVLKTLLEVSREYQHRLIEDGDPTADGR